MDALRSCLSGLSQDSGVGSSQECPPLDLDRIIVPDKHLKASPSSKLSTPLQKISEDLISTETSSFSSSASTISRKRTFSESSLSDFEVKKPEKILKQNPSVTVSQASEVITASSIGTETLVSFENLEKKSISQTINLDSGISSCSSGSLETTISSTLSLIKSFDHSSSSAIISESSEKSVNTPENLEKISNSIPNVDSSNTISSGKLTSSDNSELCIFCNNAPKDSIFLHTNIAHQCCCYKCAKRTLQTIKRCPICNRSVNKVVKIFTM